MLAIRNINTAEIEMQEIFLRSVRFFYPVNFPPPARNTEHLVYRPVIPRTQQPVICLRHQRHRATLRIVIHLDHIATTPTLLVGDVYPASTVNGVTRRLPYLPDQQRFSGADELQVGPCPSRGSAYDGE